MTIRAALYARVSTPGQAEDDRVSLPMQQAEFLRYCERRGYEPLQQVYLDVMSGARADRPDYQRLLEDARAGRFDRIVAYDVTRFGRDAEAAVLDLLILKRDTGVTVEFIRGRHRNLSDVVDDFEQGQEERERLRTRVQDAMVRVRQNGRILGRAPWGYRKEAGRLLIDDDVAPYVRELFRRYREGEGTPTIARDFTERGVTSPGGTPWSAPNLLRCLRNRTYVGISDWRGRNEDGEVAGSIECPAIISAEEFDAVQEAIARRAAMHAPRSIASTYLLGGIVFCGDCQGRMHGWNSPKVGRVYRCANKWAHSCRPTWYVNAEELERAVVDEMSREMSDVVPIEARTADRAEEARQLLEAAKKRLDTARRRMDRAVDLFFEDGDQKEWERQRRRLGEAVRSAETEVEHREAEYQSAARQAQQVTQASIRALSLAESLDTMPVPMAKARLQAIIQRVTVEERGERAGILLRF